MVELAANVGPAIPGETDAGGAAMADNMLAAAGSMVNS